MAIPRVFRAGLSPVTAGSTMGVAAAAVMVPAQLGVDIRPQDADFWCWAAVSVGINAFVTGHAREEQCRLVRRVLGHEHDCCDTHPPRPECNVDNRLEEGLAAGGVHSTPLNQTVLFADVRTQIETRGRPVGALIRFPHGKVRHFVEIDGFVDDLTPQFIVNDSLFGGPKTMDVDKFTFNYADKGGTWSWTYIIT